MTTFFLQGDNSVTIQSSCKDEVLTISVNGRFDINVQADFRRSYESESAKEIVVDLKRATYVDSAALGMLLAMKEKLGSRVGRISITHCSEQVKKVLLLTKLDRFFNIS